VTQQLGLEKQRTMYHGISKQERINQILWNATFHRQYGVSRLLLEHPYHADPNTQPPQKPCILLLACRLGREERRSGIAQFLIHNGANPNPGCCSWDADSCLRGHTPLSMAVATHQIDLIQLLLKNGARVDDQCQPNSSRKQVTPLFVAVGNQSNPYHTTAQLVHLLLQHGADPIAKCGWDEQYWWETPLYRACQRGRVEVISLLLNHGANPNVPCTRQQHTPLHVAAEQGRKDVMHLLLQHGANIAATRGNDDKTTLHLIFENDKMETMHLMTSAVELLLHFQTPVNCIDRYGHSPLDLAAGSSSSNQIVPMLLECGANPNQSPPSNRALHLAAGDNDKWPTVLALLCHGANANQIWQISNGDAITPLDCACQRKSLNNIYVLLYAMIGNGSLILS